MDHPDFDDLSAYHDGEAPEWASHVATCASCRSRLDELATLSNTVATATAPVMPPVGGDAPVRADDPVARAVAAARSAAAGGDAAVPDAPRPMAGGAVPRPAPDHAGRLPARRWRAVAAAAAVVVVVGAGLVTAAVRRDDRRVPTAARPASEGAKPSAVPPAGDASRPVAGAVGPAAPEVGSDGVTVAGSLGEIADPAALVARVGPAVRTAVAASAPDTASAGSASGSLPGPPRAVGTRPCEMEARAARPGVGPVVYLADATTRGAPAVVLAFAAPSSGAPVRVLVLSQAGCRLLLDAVVP